ncbi:hypothetical protein H0N96_03650 [Candidatus Micrarchaeota archaeon]|nr:hypothetical protein [Candidatus Micrarchaeota archaeon]
MKKNVSNAIPLFAFATALSLVLAFAPLAAAQEKEYRQVWVQWYFLTGSNIGECNANCVSACMPTCFSTAAASGIESTNCGSMCSSTCAGKCPGYFATAATTANDGLQVPQTPRGWTAQDPWSGETTTEQMPCAPGQQFCTTYSPAETVSQTEGEPSYPEMPDCAPEHGCYPGTGITNPTQTCPETAADGHPMRWDSIMGCYDVFWKNDYCGQATSCSQNNPCTARQGCIWNGVACIPCTAPSCNYFCPRVGGGGGANAQQPQQNNPITVQQKQIPYPSPVPTQPVILPIEIPSSTPTGGGTVAPTVMPSATAGATAIPTSIPTPVPTLTLTPEVQCNYYSSCLACANAPKGADGKSQCGWSEFLDVCIDGKSWGVINETGLKAGWVDKKEFCPNAEEAYCFKNSDCFSCTGKAGVKRRCQWSVKDNSCQPYDPLGDFKTESNPNGSDVILPNQCANQDCLQYSNCAQCEQNAACQWSKNGDGKCGPFNGGDTGSYYFYPGNCPANASAPAPTPRPCPNDCKCDSKTSRVIACGGSRVNDSGFVQTDRAAANAQAATSIEQLDGITFTQQADGNASFTVQGHKTNAFLFVIPMRVDVSATVNAKTGAVEKVEQPWWSFFTG